jgi:hypothetical protein
MTRRAPLPTLTEDDLREQGERTTLPPPVPIGELVGQMMRDVEGDAHPRAAPTVGGATGASGAPALELELDDLEGSAESSLLVEIRDEYLVRLGGRSQVPFALPPPDDIHRRPLDHWAGFVLSLVDGAASVDDILDAASMPEHEALHLLCELREQGLIGLR